MVYGWHIRRYIVMTSPRAQLRAALKDGFLEESVFFLDGAAGRHHVLPLHGKHRTHASLAQVSLSRACVSCLQLDVSKLGWKNRLIGFGVCLSLAGVFAVLVSSVFFHMPVLNHAHDDRAVRWRM